MKSQKEQILEYLDQKGSITQDEAKYYLGISRLASRVDELRKLGHPIITERVEGKNRFGVKCHWAKYSMRRAVQ